MNEASDPPMAAKDRAQNPDMQEKAQEVADMAGEKAHEAAGSAQEMLRDQLDQRSTKAGETAVGTAQDLRSVGEELRKQGKDTPARLADRAAERTDQLGSYLRESDADRMLSDVEDFGRRQPLAVLAGGLVAGIVAARFLKASSRGRYQSRRAGESTRELSATTPARARGVYPEAPDSPPRESSQQVPVPSDPVTLP